jgi:hypothetical protein
VLSDAAATGDGPSEIYPHPLTGFPVVRSGHLITSEDVRSLEDED